MNNISVTVTVTINETFPLVTATVNGFISVNGHFHYR